MARYISTAQRRRKAAVIAVVALLIGLAAGFGLGRLTTTSVGDQVASVRAQARETTGGLRVLALHAQAGVGGTADVGPVLEKTRSGLSTELAKAPWVGVATRQSLVAELDALAAMPPTAPGFAEALTRLADRLDQVFGS